MIPYANSVIASLQYANTVTAIFPLCQSSTLPFCSMMNLQHDSITIATEQESPKIQYEPVNAMMLMNTHHRMG